MFKLRIRVSAFTIVELLVVIVIIGILASITVVSYTGITNRAKVAILQSDLNKSSKQIELFKAQNGIYPSNINDCPNPSSVSLCLSSSNGATYTSYVSTANTFTLIETASDGATRWRIANNSRHVVVVPKTGLLTALVTPTISTASSPRSIAISSDGSSIYVANMATITMYSRDSLSGDLAALSPSSTYPGPGSPNNLTVSPDGVSVYATDSLNEVAYLFSRDASTGILTYVVGGASVTGARAIVISPDNKYAYVANNSTNKIHMFSRDISTGALTPLSTPTINTSTNPYSVAISSDGKSVYVANNTSNNVSMYSRDSSTGLLSALSTPTIAAQTAPTAIGVSSDGDSVYVVNGTSRTISMFSRN